MAKLHLTLSNGPRLYRCNFTVKKTEKLNEEVNIGCEFSILTGVKKQGNEAFVRLGAKCDNQSLPFSFDVESEARFTCDKKCAPDAELVKEAIPYIFPFLKEFVADLTRKANFAPFYLPPLDLRLDILDQVPAEVVPPPKKRRTKKGDDPISDEPKVPES